MPVAEEVVLPGIIEPILGLLGKTKDYINIVFEAVQKSCADETQRRELARMTADFDKVVECVAKRESQVRLSKRRRELKEEKRQSAASAVSAKKKKPRRSRF